MFFFKKKYILFDWVLVVSELVVEEAQFVHCLQNLSSRYRTNCIGNNNATMLLPPANQVCEGLCFHRCLSVQGGVCPFACWDTPPRQTPPWANPPGRHPPGQTPWADSPPLRSACWDTVNKRRYASHMNAFLFKFKFYVKKTKPFTIVVKTRKTRF